MQVQSFEDFQKQEHQRRVDYFIRFLESGDRAPLIRDAEQIFSISKEECKQILTDAVTQMSMRLL